MQDLLKVMKQIKDLVGTPFLSVHGCAFMHAACGRGGGRGRSCSDISLRFSLRTSPHLHLYAHPLCPKDITFFHFKHFCEFNEIFNFYARQMDKEVWRGAPIQLPPPLQLLTLPLPSSCALRPCLSLGLTSRRDMLHLLCILGGQLSTKINKNHSPALSLLLPIPRTTQPAPLSPWPPPGSILFVAKKLNWLLVCSCIALYTALWIAATL